MPQEIIFTTLPNQKQMVNGREHLKVSVFVSVKLQTPNDTTLSEFEDILNFPQKIKEGDFQFKLNNGQIVDGILQDTLIDPELFQNILHPNIKVDDFKQENFTAKRIYSFPIVHIKEFIIKNYRQIAIESPKKLVTADKFIDQSKFGAISRFQLDETKIQQQAQPNRPAFQIKAPQLIRKNTDDDRQLNNNIRQNNFMRFSKQMNPKTDFVQLRQFHKLDKKIIKGPLKPIKKPEFEFHDIMAVINSYPQIMRKMGFIIDFLIDDLDAFSSSGTIQLIPKAIDFEEEGTVVSTPATAYTINDNGFYIADKASSIFKKGFVKINTDAFSVVQIDADGTALKTHGMAENKAQEVARFYENRSVMMKRAPQLRQQTKVEELEVAPPEDEGLPYMRSAGIAVTKNGMAEHLFASMQLNLQLQTSFLEVQPRVMQLQRKIVPLNVSPTLKLKVKEPTKVLYSDELIQGYRMDIAYEDHPKRWFSLHQRQEEYKWFDNTNLPHNIEGIVPDEGFIQLGIAEDPDDPDDVFVSETLARWEGWSLSVRKPGFAINESDDYELKGNETEKKDFVHTSKVLEAKKYEFDPDLDFKINAQSKIVPGTLPMLRFGKGYRVRIRAVDLAGNSVPLNHPTESASETVRANIRYMRYEPLASPIMLVGNELKDGEFPERMVIRSNYDQSCKKYEREHKIRDGRFDEYSHRYLLPPKNSQLMAETHGKFDQAFGNNPVVAQEIYNIITSHEELFEQDEKNKEKIYKPSEVEIKYLPDPMAAGVALFLADDYEQTHTQEFAPRLFGFFSKKEIKPGKTNDEIPMDWYNAQYINIRLEEGELGSDWHAGSRTFTITLPKGHRTRIKFSTFWREEDLMQLSAIWEMIKEDSPTNLAELKKLATSGQHWMVSPSREIELVHAVQQPVDAPKINELIPERAFNSTMAEINTEFDVHGESTEKLELRATWIDPLDDAISVDIKEKAGTNSISDIMVNYHDDIITKGTIPEPDKKFQPATEFQVQRPLKIQKRTLTQFEREPQPKARKMNQIYLKQANQYQLHKNEESQAKKSLHERVKFDIMETKFSLFTQMKLRIKPLEQHFGDTKHRWVDYQLIAASRYREYFDKIFARYEKLKSYRESEPVEKVNILSTARPKVPEIDYIIPTFEWIKNASGNTMVHHRLGGGLRIYIKRPWFSSGVDERLAVVLPDKTMQAVSYIARGSMEKYTPYYTHWGVDPILQSTQPQGYSPRFQDFRRNPVYDSDLEYPDVNNRRAAVAAYPVHFDKDRQLWYCDIAINTQEMYFPFVKLALARYQQHSVKVEKEDVCLSPVVMTNFNQLVPDRKTTIETIRGAQYVKLSITVEGTIYNERQAKYGNYSFLKISFLDSNLEQPIHGMIDDALGNMELKDSTVEIKITSRDIKQHRYTIERNVRLPEQYKEGAYQVIIEEYERGPSDMPMDKSGYNDRLEQSAETDRLIYADVFKVNTPDEPKEK